jgi:ribonuclease D
VAERLGVELEQHETRSDWLARPLSAEQVQLCLRGRLLPAAAARARFTRRWSATGRLAWFREEMDQRGRFELNDPDTYYLA